MNAKFSFFINKIALLTLKKGLHGMYQLLDDVNVTFKTGGLEIWVEFYDKLEFWTSAPELDMFEEYTFKEIKSEIFENCED